MLSNQMRATSQVDNNTDDDNDGKAMIRAVETNSCEAGDCDSQV